MAARRSSKRPADPGLTDDQVSQLREDVSAGRHPRVRIVGGRPGSATVGTVRRVGEPGVDGEDFVTVRVTISGVTDELRFAPGELARGRKAAAARPRAVPPATTRSTAAPAVASSSPRRTGRRAPAGAPVSIVLTSHDAAWAVSAHRGSRSVLKNAAVTPGVVSAIAELLGQPALDEAVAAVNDTARAEAERRAAQLRDELARVEAVLDTHRRP